MECSFKENKTINNSDDNDYNSNHFSSDYYVWVLGYVLYLQYLFFFFNQVSFVALEFIKS